MKTWHIICVAVLAGVVTWYHGYINEEKRHKDRMEKFKKDAMDQFKEMQSA